MAAFITKPSHPMKRILLLLTAGFYFTAWALSWLNAGPPHGPAAHPGLENGAEINQPEDAPGSLRTWEPEIVGILRPAQSVTWG
ncbi:MAG: hypothetical protein JWM59_3505 [Verrucomicrobiales bacterium]|nr:hypothetical protein [Verrucomicrobiales bacterium]